MRRGQFNWVGWILALIVLAAVLYIVGRYLAPLLIGAPKMLTTP